MRHEPVEAVYIHNVMVTPLITVAVNKEGSLVNMEDPADVPAAEVGLSTSLD